MSRLESDEAETPPDCRLLVGHHHDLCHDSKRFERLTKIVFRHVLAQPADEHFLSDQRSFVPFKIAENFFRFRLLAFESPPCEVMLSPQSPGGSHAVIKSHEPEASRVAWVIHPYQILSLS